MVFDGFWDTKLYQKSIWVAMRGANILSNPPAAGRAGASGRGRGGDIYVYIIYTERQQTDLHALRPEASADLRVIVT